MTALLTTQTLGGTANVALTGDVSVIVSGNFSGGAVVRLDLEADSLRKSPTYIRKPDTLSIKGKTGMTLTATVTQGNSECSIDVSVL